MIFKTVFILAACAACACAQQTIGETDVYYDSGRNVVYAVGSTSADYNSQYYYTPWVYTAMFNGSQIYEWDSEPGSTYVESPATPGQEVVVESTHTLSVVYEVYEINSYCTDDCYDWWDNYGYELINNGGDPSEEGPTYTVWTVGAPIIVTSAVSQIVVDQESGGRYRPAGPPANYDVRLRSFIPPLYVTGPEPFCFPFTNKSVLYNGNNRGFNEWSVSYKGHQSVTLLPNNQLQFLAVNEVGPTERFASDALVNGPFGPTLAWDTVLHDCYQLDDVGQASNTGMSQSYGSPGANQMSVQFSGSISNPLTPDWLTPSIDWSVVMLVNTSNPSAPTYTLLGQHDCFPAWEAFIGDMQVWGYTPDSYSVATIAGCLSATWPYSQVNVSANGPL